MKTTKFNVTGMTCSACSSHVEKAVSAVNGVENVSVSLLTNSMNVEISSPASIQAVCDAVSAAGYNAKPSETADKNISSKNAIEDKETPALKLRLISSVIILIPLMYVSMGYVMWNWYLPSALASNPMAIGLYQLLLTAVVMVINQRFFIRTLTLTF